MPTIHREAGFVFQIFSDDHLPAHVHVSGGGGAIKVLLGDDEVRPSILIVKGMKKQDIVRAFRIVEKHRDAFLAKWRSLHGT